MRGKQLVAAGLLAVGALLAGSIPSGIAAEAKPKEVVIGVQVIPNGETLAKAKGWYEKALGTKVSFKQFDSGRDVNTALAAKAIDIGLLGTTPASVGISRGIPYEVFWIHDVIGEAESLAVKNKAGINSVKDLVGKKVAVPIGSTAHFSLLSAIKLAGIKAGDVKILDLQPPDILAAWQRGDIDAAYVWQPTLAKLLADDGKVITDSRKLAKKGYVTADIGVVRTEFARAYPELVANYVKIQLKAYKHYKGDIKDTSATIGKELNIDPAEALKEINELVWLSGKEQISKAYFGTSTKKGALAKILKSTADFLVEQKSIDKAPGLDVFEKAVNPAFIEKALK